MSDIYLQITETPTVVTLSAPVVSGALASTVTVANTVTVALDSNSLSALENVTVTVGAAITGTVTVSNFPASQAVTFSAVTISNFPSTQTIAGTVTANAGANVATAFYDGIAKWANGPGGDGSLPIYVGISSGQTLGGLKDGEGYTFGIDRDFPIAGTVNIGSALPTGTNRIGVVTIGAGTVTIGAGTAQIGSVTASISGTVPVSGTFFQGTQPVSLTTLPALVAGTAQIGSVTASISNSVTIASFATSVTARLINPAGTAVTYAEVGTAGNPSIDVLSVQGVTSGTPLTILNHQGTTVTTSNFTSTTASTVLASANTSREVLTIFNEGAGNLHICAGATCTTIAYQVRLSAGDYYEVPLNQTSLTHSAVFATAGTARIVQIS
jgi:hypothetical protein